MVYRALDLGGLFRMWLRTGSSGGLLCNELSGSIKVVEFPDLLSDYSFSRRTLLHGVSKLIHL